MENSSLSVVLWTAEKEQEYLKYLSNSNREYDESIIENMIRSRGNMISS